MTEVLAEYCASLKHHLVLSEGPGFVTEHILHLAQLFWDVEGPALHSLLVYGVVHEGVIMDEINLRELSQLYSHVQGQRNDDL